MNQTMMLAASACGAENCAHLPPINELIWGGLAFLIVVGLLWWKGGPAIRNAWNGRIERIEGELDAAADTRQSAEAELAGVRDRIANVDTERQRIVEEARQTAATLKAQLVERAQAEAAEVAQRATADIEAAKAQALADLRSEVGALAMGAAEEVVRESLDADTQRSLVESYISQVGASS